jgi:hypothetical protein
MITYNNHFQIAFVSKTGNWDIEDYKANPVNIEKDMRDKLKRMKQDGKDIIEVRQSLEQNWVKYIR